jgi:hypothetical protein
MQRKSILAAVAFAAAGALLAGTCLALPDPARWRAADGYLIREAYRLGPSVAAATFPGWQPGSVPVLVTNGRANYLVSPWDGAPAGRPVAADGLAVRRLDRLVIPVIANAAIPVNDRPVALITSKALLEQTLGGIITELDMAAGGEAGLVRSLLKAGSGRRITPEEYVGVILHESFHIYQLPVLEQWWDRLGDDQGQRELWAILYADSANNQWQTREGELLLDAVEAPDRSTARAAVDGFLAVRAERAAYWTGKLGEAKASQLLEWERLYEWQEGLACYIQMQTYLAGSGPGYTPLPEVAKLAGYNGYHEGAETGRDYLIAQIGLPVESAAPRDRVCRLGAGQALALDRLLPAWQGQAAQGAPLTRLLQQVSAGSQE